MIRSCPTLVPFVLNCFCRRTINHLFCFRVGTLTASSALTLTRNKKRNVRFAGRLSIRWRLTFLCKISSWAPTRSEMRSLPNLGRSRSRCLNQRNLTLQGLSMNSTICVWLTLINQCRIRTRSPPRRNKTQPMLRLTNTFKSTSQSTCASKSSRKSTRTLRGRWQPAVRSSRPRRKHSTHLPKRRRTASRGSEKCRKSSN